MRSLKLVLLMLAVSLSCQAQFGGNQTGGDLSGYTSKKDIDYVGDGHIGHKLDIYYPNDGKATHNVIIHIYGSAWGSNNSKGSADLGTVGKAALEAGYIFVTPNHRTYNDALYPAQINDIKAVVRYLRGNAATLKIDASFIAISGFSSGGHLASLMGVTRNVKSTYTVGSATMDIEGTLGAYTSYSSWVDAVCDWSGPVDCRYKTCGNPINMSPENDMVGGCSKDQCPDKHALLGANTFIDASDAPVMVVHGSSDNIVPQCEGEMFYNNSEESRSRLRIFPYHWRTRCGCSPHWRYDYLLQPYQKKRGV
jgi:acetyl esterase/lipase